MEIESAVRAFAALSQEKRLEAVRLLVRAGSGGVAAGDIAETLGLPAPTMSFHLKELVQAGLIQSRRDGRKVFYAADYGGVRDLINFLLEDCCAGDRRLCGPYVISKECA